MARAETAANQYTTVLVNLEQPASPAETDPFAYSGKITHGVPPLPDPYDFDFSTVPEAGFDAAIDQEPVSDTQPEAPDLTQSVDDTAEDITPTAVKPAADSQAPLASAEVPVPAQPEAVLNEPLAATHTDEAAASPAETEVNPVQKGSAEPLSGLSDHDKASGYYCNTGPQSQSTPDNQQLQCLTEGKLNLLGHLFHIPWYIVRFVKSIFNM